MILTAKFFPTPVSGPHWKWHWFPVDQHPFLLVQRLPGDNCYDVWSQEPPRQREGDGRRNPGCLPRLRPRRRIIALKSCPTAVVKREKNKSASFLLPFLPFRSLSNSYLETTAIIFGAKSFHGSNKEAVGATLVSGLSTGSLLSSLVLQLLWREEN